MPPRANDGLDFTPILTHYLFLFTTVLAVVRAPSVPEHSLTRPAARLVHCLHITSHRNGPV